MPDPARTAGAGTPVSSSWIRTGGCSAAAAGSSDAGDGSSGSSSTSSPRIAELQHRGHPWSSTITAAWSPPVRPARRGSRARRDRAGRSGPASGGTVCGRPAEPHRRAQPLERPAAAHPQPGERQQDDRERDRRGEGDRAVQRADQHGDRGDLGGDELAGADAEQPSTPDRRGPDLGKRFPRAGQVGAGHRPGAASTRHACRHPAHPPDRMPTLDVGGFIVWRAGRPRGSAVVHSSPTLSTVSDEGYRDGSAAATVSDE